MFFFKEKLSFRNFKGEKLKVSFRRRMQVNFTGILLSLSEVTLKMKQTTQSFSQTKIGTTKTLVIGNAFAR